MRWKHEDGLRTYLVEQMDKLRPAISANNTYEASLVFRKITEDGYPELSSMLLATLAAAGLDRSFILAAVARPEVEAA